jgi:uncharacterized protein YraI
LVAPAVTKETSPVEVAAIEPVAPVKAIEPVPVSKANPNQIASHESVNVRSGPGRSETKVFVLEAGVEVTVTEKHRGWLHITAGKRSGWAYSDSFESGDVKALTVSEVAVATLVDTKRVQSVAPKAKATPAGSYAAKVLGKGVTVRSGPGKTNGAIFSLAAGKTVTVLETKSGWLRIIDAQGRQGWLYKDFVRSL